MLQNIELELQNLIFLYWTLDNWNLYFSAVYVKFEFSKTWLNSRKLFSFPILQKDQLIWYNTWRLQMVIMIRPDYLLAVCCSEQWLHSGHFSAGSSTERNPHLLPAETADDHYDQIAVSLDLYRFIQTYLSRFNIALSFCRTLVDRVINWKMEENRSDHCQTCSHLLAGYCSEQLLHTCRPGGYQFKDARNLILT